MHFEDVVKSFQHLSEWDQVQAVDQFWDNYVKYHPTFNESWTTPDELLTTGYGNSEDLAVAKFFTCRALGIPTERLRLVYMTVNSVMLLDGKEVDAVEGYMLLRYFPEPLSFRNHKMRNKKGVESYAFNDKNVWIDGEPVSDAQTIKKWRRVLAKMA